MVITRVELVENHSSLDGTIARNNRFFILLLTWGKYGNNPFEDFSHGTFKYINTAMGKHAKMMRNEVIIVFSL